MKWLIVIFVYYIFNKFILGNLTKNFTLKELNKHDFAIPLQCLPNLAELAKNLQVIRDFIGKPVHVNSGYRSPEFNKKIGGATNSFHTKGMASDIRVDGMSASQLKTIIELLIKDGKIKQGGVGLYPTFVHYDIRGVKARWHES